MQKTKRNRSKESTRRTREMRDACIEIQNENIVSWNKRRKLQEKEKKQVECYETESLERLKRKNIGENKKKALLKSIKARDGLNRKRNEDELEWLKEKRSHWRNYRENLPNDDSISDNLTDLVRGKCEKSVEKISEIGRRVEFKLKEAVFKRKFSDLSKSDYLRQETPTAVTESFMPDLMPKNCSVVDSVSVTINSTKGESIPATQSYQHMLVDFKYFHRKIFP